MVRPLRATSVKQWVRTGTWLRNHLHWYWYPWIAYSMASFVVYFLFAKDFSFSRKAKNTEPYPQWLKIHLNQTHFKRNKILPHAFAAANLRKMSLYLERYFVYEYFKPKNSIHSARMNFWELCKDGQCLDACKISIWDSFWKLNFYIRYISNHHKNSDLLSRSDGLKKDGKSFLVLFVPQEK